MTDHTQDEKMQFGDSGWAVFRRGDAWFAKHLKYDSDVGPFSTEEQAWDFASVREVMSDDTAFIWKWVERGLFDPAISPKDALSILAHYPGAPWRKGRWDVDHKPYAAKFYAQFPTARASATEREKR